MKISIWMASRDRDTWILAAEIFVLALVLFYAPGTTIRVLLGLPLLVHVGYRALTSLPLGMIPGRPPGAKERRNQDLRSRVVGFLNEVRRVEEYAERAQVAGRPPAEVENNLRSAEKRLMAAAAEVVKVAGRNGG